MRNYNGIQTKLETISKYGCYLLSIASHFNYDGDIVELYDVLLEKKYIAEDCTILNPDEIAWEISGVKYNCFKVTELPKLNDGDWYVECWHNKRTGLTHFKLPDTDTLKNSVTVKEGNIIGYRYFKEIK